MLKFSVADVSLSKTVLQFLRNTRRTTSLRRHLRFFSVSSSLRVLHLFSSRDSKILTPDGDDPSQRLCVTLEQ